MRDARETDAAIARDLPGANDEGRQVAPVSETVAGFDVAFTAPG